MKKGGRKNLWAISSGGIVFIVIILIVSSTRIGSAFRYGIVRSAAPLLRISGAFEQRIRTLVSGDSAQQIDAMRQENERLSILVAQLQSMRRENEDLRAALDFKKRHSVGLQGADVLGRGNESGSEFLLIGQGQGAEVDKGALVVDAAGGLVGRVHESDSEFAKVIVASSPGQTFEASVIPIGIKTLARGIGGRTFSLELIPAHVSLRRGDFVTIQTDARETPILLATVIATSTGGTSAFQEVKAILIARPELLDAVFVRK
ncbi:MAG: rod shape-determining protein MreC [Candidatus Sungbacteria bacterium]|nr:rod shape-determining protein MreC [Candidatus Sungbacteria bacterium]